MCSYTIRPTIQTNQVCMGGSSRVFPLSGPIEYYVVPGGSNHELFSWAPNRNRTNITSLQVRCNNHYTIGAFCEGGGSRTHNIYYRCQFRRLVHESILLLLLISAVLIGLEPITYWLTVNCSTIELKNHQWNCSLPPYSYLRLRNNSLKCYWVTLTIQLRTCGLYFVIITRFKLVFLLLKVW